MRSFELAAAQRKPPFFLPSFLPAMVEKEERRKERKVLVRRGRGQRRNGKTLICRKPSFLLHLAAPILRLARVCGREEGSTREGPV